MCDIRSTAVLHFDRGEEGSAEQLAAEKFEHQFKNKYFAERCSGSEEASYLSLVDLCITQLNDGE